MIGLLARIFIRDHKNTAEPRVRSAYGTLCSLTGVGLNVVLCAIKLVAGVLSGSVAVTADALNNLSDAGSSLITFAGFRLAEKKPDKDHPFGHGRFEYISGFIVAVLILVMGFELGRASIGRILHPEEVDFSALSFMILGVSILVKLYMFAYNRRWGKKLDAPAMLATARDSLSDCVSTAVVLVCAVITRLTGAHIDGWAGCAVALFILWTGVGTARETLAPLLGSPPSREFVDEIESVVMSHDCVIGMHDLIIHDYGPGRRMISLHAEVPASGDFIGMHDAVDHIENELEERLGCAAVIHMDPVADDDEEIAAMRERMLREIRELDPSLTLHDFRAVRGPTHTNLIFDVVSPRECPIPDAELSARIVDRVEREWPACHAVVKIDKPFV